MVLVADEDDGDDVGARVDDAASPRIAVGVEQGGALRAGRVGRGRCLDVQLQDDRHPHRRLRTGLLKRFFPLSLMGLRG